MQRKCHLPNNNKKLLTLSCKYERPAKKFYQEKNLFRFRVLSCTIFQIEFRNPYIPGKLITTRLSKVPLTVTAACMYQLGVN